MEFKIKNLPKSEIEITVTVDSGEMEKHRKKAAEELSKDVKVKGFRPGHVPQHVLENYVDKKFIDAHTQELAIKMTYAQVVMGEKIQVVSKPKIDIKEDKDKNDDGFTYVATVAILPEITLDDYKSIKVKKEKVEATDKDVEAVIKDMKKHNTTYKKVDRGAKKGDRCEIDFAGYDEKGKEVESTKSKHHPVIIGEGSLIPGFEEEVVGLKANEEKEFDITFPKDYHKKDFQNKKMKFKVKVHVVEEAEEPELNEELIEKVTGKKMKVKELEDDIKKNIQKTKESEARKKRENEYIEKLVKKAKVEVPEALIEEEIDFIIMEMKNDIKQRGMEFDQFLKAKKTSEEELRKNYKDEAERRIKIRLALQEIIKKEKIEASDKDVQEELKKIKEMYPPTESKKIDEEFEKGPLKNQIMNKLILDKLFASVLGD